MSFKNVARMTGDILDMVSRGQLIWQLLTLTKAGQFVLASVAAAGVFAIAVIRSDPWMAAVLFGLIAFTVVVVLTHFAFSLKTRPHLKHGNIVGLQYELGDAKFGTEEGGFMWGDSFLRPLVVRISNKQEAIDVPANNARALISYEHDDKRDKIRANAVWATQGRQGIELIERIQIESGQTALLVLIFEYPPTPNLTAPGAKTTNDYLATADLFSGSHYKKFNAGHWNVLIEVTSDNSAPLLIKGGFTITRDERIKFDVPALRKLGTSPPEFRHPQAVDFR